MNKDSKWIYHPQWEPAPCDARYGNPSPCFRNEFSVSAPVAKAILRVTALGVCKVKINGEFVDSDRFVPGWTDYRQRIYYEEYDVTGMIRAENCIFAVLGDGWYAGMLGLYFKRNFYGDTPMLRAELEVQTKDGQTLSVMTGAGWKCSFGEIRGNDFFNGEIWDARERQEGCDLYGFDDGAWSAAAVSEKNVPQPQKSPCERVRVAEVLQPVKTEESGGRLRLDFGQNFAGVLRVAMRGACGSKIVIRHGEMLRENGDLYTGNLRTAAATDTYICRGEGTEVFQPLFTYHGFRYAEITAEGDVQVLKAEGLVIWSQLSRTGEFFCDDEIVSKVYSNALWGQKSNFVSIPTDCPQRDERLGWTGDAQIFCGSAMFNYDCRRFFAKYMADVCDAAYDNGEIAIFAPYTHPDRCPATSAWGDVITILPYTHYLMYGDDKILRMCLPYMKKWLAFCTEKTENYIRFGPTYADWLNVDEVTDARPFSTLYYACSAEITAKACGVLGDADETYYRELYDTIRRRFREEFVGADGKIFNDTQTVYLLAYAFGAASAEEIRPHLVRKIRERDYHLSCGFCGIKFLLPVLCEIGESALAYRLAAETSYPSWGYSVVNGATTIWERWNSYTYAEGFADETMNSFNHYSLGSCAEWMYRCVLGINPVEEAPGFKEVLLRPYPDFSGRINKAGGAYRTDYGEIRVGWERKGDCIIYNCEVPPAVRARVEFPQGTVVRQENNKYILRCENVSDQN